MSYGERGEYLTPIDRDCPTCGVSAGVACTSSAKGWLTHMVHPPRKPTAEDMIRWHAERVPLIERLRGRSFIPGVHYGVQADAWMREAADVIEGFEVVEALR